MKFPCMIEFDDLTQMVVYSVNELPIGKSFCITEIPEITPMKPWVLSNLQPQDPDEVKIDCPDEKHYHFATIIKKLADETVSPQCELRAKAILKTPQMFNLLLRLANSDIQILKKPVELPDGSWVEVQNLNTKVGENIKLEIMELLTYIQVGRL